MKTIVIVTGLILIAVAGSYATPQFDDLVKLVKSGASEEVVVAYVNASDSNYNLSSDDIVRLKESGATPRVIITALQHKKTVAAAGVAPSASQAETVQATPPPQPPTVYRVVPAWNQRRAARYYWYDQTVGKMDQAFQVNLDLNDGFTLNYEYLLHHQHGIVVEGSYYSGRDSHGENAMLAYRWHWAQSMNSGFFSAFIKGGRYYGTESAISDGPSIGYAQTSVTIGPAIGKRWVFPWGLSMVARLGYGYTWSIFDNTIPDQSTQNWLRDGLSFDSELSIGFAFK